MGHQIFTRPSLPFSSVTASNSFEVYFKLVATRDIEKAHYLKVWNMNMTEVLELTTFLFEGSHVLV